MKNSSFLYDFFKKGNISNENLKLLLETEDFNEILFKLAKIKRNEHHKNYVNLRGLIEFTNNCENNCYYCGIRKSSKIFRYRLSKKEILKCCEKADKQGIKTFVLQGGQDPNYKDEELCQIIREIKENFKDCTITLSIGEKSKKSYESFFKAGARRFLLRQETASSSHYEMLHPKNMSLKNRKNCLFTLKEIGFKVGAGFLVNSPHQTTNNIIKDLNFLKELNPFMIGIGPFIPQKQTPFKNHKAGSFKLTVKLISILRLMFPFAMIPSTTSLNTLKEENSLKISLDAGANVLMPNMTPKKYQIHYNLYDNKPIRTNKTIKSLKKKLYTMGYKFKVYENILQKN